MALHPARPASAPQRTDVQLSRSTVACMWLGVGLAGYVSVPLGVADDGAQTLLIACSTVAVVQAGLRWWLIPNMSPRQFAVTTGIGVVLANLMLGLVVYHAGGRESPILVAWVLPTLYVAYFFSRQAMGANLAFTGSILALVSYLRFDEAAPGATTRLLLLYLGLCAVAVAVSRSKELLVTAGATARKQALVDPLTGAWNLRGLRTRLEERPLQIGDAVVIIDIDNFKQANARYGHTGADRLLKAVVAECAVLVPAPNVTARIGGDEFVLIFEQAASRGTDHLLPLAATAAARARARAGLQGPDISATVGAVRCDDSTATLAALLEQADAQMLGRKHREARGRGDGNDKGSVFVPQEAAAAKPATRRLSPRAWWQQKPARARASALALWAVTLATLAVALSPEHDVDRPGLLALILVAAALSGLLYLIAPPRSLMAAVIPVEVVANAAGLAGVIWLTGGPNSPLLPFVLVPTGVGAYFGTRTEGIASIGMNTLAAVSPMLYATAEQRSDYSPNIVAMFTLAVVIWVAFRHNQRHLRAAEAQARAEARRDALTDLPNRRAFAEVLADAVDIARGTPDAMVCTAIIDLDNFKHVNDRHGHAAGDLLLQRIADALRLVVRDGDTIARIGGDEFAVVAPGSGFTAANTLGHRCLGTAEGVAAELGFGDCDVSATVGFAIYPNDADTADGLVMAADTALVQAKQAGKRRVAAPTL